MLKIIACNAVWSPACDGLGNINKQQALIKQPLPWWINIRSSCPEVFCKKDVLRNFAKFTVKHLCQISFLIKLLC